MEYKQISNSTMTVLQDFNGMKLEIVMSTNGTMIFLVKKVNEEGYDMEAKLENMRMTMQMPQGLMEFNSEKNDPNDILSAILGEMKGKSFDITMSKTGKITDVKSVDTIWNTAINQFDDLPESQKEQMKAQIMKMYSGEALKGNIEMATAIYPDKPVRKGDKWTINTKLESGMNANISTVYEFADLTADYALIKGTATIASADNDATIESNGIAMNIDFDGSMQSEIKVDRNSGWIIDAQINQKIKGDTNIKENAQVENGMKISMSMTNDTHIKNR